MSDFDRAVALLRAGELVAFPTDTVYGVSAVAWNRAAVAKLYVAKLRQIDKAIPILLADPADLDLVARRAVPPRGDAPGRAFLARPVDDGRAESAAVPEEVTAGGETVAVRVPDHPLARALIRAVGAPLATTSANLRAAPARSPPTRSRRSWPAASP